MATDPPSSSAAEPAEPTPSPSASDAATPSPRIVRRSSGNRTWLILIVVVIVVVAVVGAGYELHWFGGAPKATAVAACPTGNILQGEGAALINPLVSAWAPTYNAASGNTLNYNPAGSGAGVTALTDKQVDFAASDAPLSPAQRNALPSPALTLPVTAGALAIIYNVGGVSSGLQLSGPVLADIYLGKITLWNDPRIASNNTGITLPPNPIITVHRSDSAGASFVLTSFLAADSNAWATGPGVGESISWPTTPSMSGQSGNTKMLSYVTNTANTIGYTDLSDALATQSASPFVGIAKVLNPAGNYIAPTAESTATAVEHLAVNTTFPASGGDWGNVTMINSNGVNDYPLTTLIYFFVYQSLSAGYAPTLEKAQDIGQWISWILSTGQGVATQYNYAPLPSAVISDDQTGLSTLTYSGSSLPACH